MAKVLLSKKNLRSIRIFRIGVGICSLTIAFKHCMAPAEVCFNTKFFHSQMSAVLIAPIDVILNFQTSSQKQKSSG